jgi:hypothetical protein
MLLVLSPSSETTMKEPNGREKEKEKKKYIYIYIYIYKQRAIAHLIFYLIAEKLFTALLHQK